MRRGLSRHAPAAGIIIVETAGLVHGISVPGATDNSGGRVKGEHAAASGVFDRKGEDYIPGRGFFPPRQGSNRDGERSVHRQVFAQRPGDGKCRGDAYRRTETNRDRAATRSALTGYGTRRGDDGNRVWEELCG